MAKSSSSRNLFWWIIAGTVGLIVAALAADRWLFAPQQWSGTDGIVTEEELAGEMSQVEMFATGANFTVQKFPVQDNCTLSVELGKEAIVGMSRNKAEVLSFFFSSLAKDITAARTLTVQFGTEAPWTLQVTRVVTVVNIPVLLLEVPTDLEREWRQSGALTVGAAGKPVGRFETGEAQTKGPDTLAACANSL